MSTELEGLTIVADNSGQASEAIGRAVMKALEEIGIAAEAHAMNMSPVDTGRLKNSITHAVDAGEGAVYIGTNVSYAEAQELGTSKMAAANGGRGFLRPAATDHADEYREIVRTNMEGA